MLQIDCERNVCRPLRYCHASDQPAPLSLQVPRLAFGDADYSKSPPPPPLLSSPFNTPPQLLSLSPWPSTPNSPLSPPHHSTALADTPFCAVAFADVCPSQGPAGGEWAC